MPDTNLPVTEPAVRDQLEAAPYLSLTARSRSLVSEAFIQSLLEAATSWERQSGCRAKGRGPKSIQSLRIALEGLCGGLLLNGSVGAAWSYRPTDSKAFTGGAISYRTFSAALEAAKAAGWVEVKDGFRQFLAPKGGDGWSPARNWAPRFRLTPHFLSLAAPHGLYPENAADHFALVPETAAKNLLVLKKPSARAGHLKVTGSGLTFHRTAESDRLLDEVVEVNSFIAGHTIAGCLPVQLRRIFNGGWDRGGRWYALGASNYQGMKKEDRLGITINGADVVEVDVKASYLTCLYGRLGINMDGDPDPYAVTDLPREVVKAFVTATLGNGSPISRWPKGCAEDLTAKGIRLKDFPAGLVGKAVLGRHPVLGDLKRLGMTWDRLMNLEALAITIAMLTLKREWGAVALPVHDSVIVESKFLDQACNSLRAGYRLVVGAEPKLEPRLKKIHLR